MNSEDAPPCQEEHECGCDPAVYETTTDRVIDAVKSVLEFALLCLAIVVIFLGLGGDLPWQGG